MKTRIKYQLMVLFAIVILPTLLTSQIDELNYTVYIGGNYSKPKFENYNREIKSSIGLIGGIMVDYEISDLNSLQVSIEFEEVGLKEKGYSKQVAGLPVFVNSKNSYLNLILEAQQKFNRLSISGGLYYSRLLKIKQSGLNQVPLFLWGAVAI